MLRLITAISCDLFPHKSPFGTNEVNNTSTTLGLGHIFVTEYEPGLKSYRLKYFLFLSGVPIQGSLEWSRLASWKDLQFLLEKSQSQPVGNKGSAFLLPLAEIKEGKDLRFLFSPPSEVSSWASLSLYCLWFDLQRYSSVDKVSQWILQRHRLAI